ncbi:MAG: gliding motility protein GldN [Cytophagaceae bacterium]|nr:gliding motility protein GldN [Cytophagaceae bacterium]
MKKIVLFTGLLFGLAGTIFSQKVHESDMMFKKTVIRAVDLREKQNKPFFSKNRELTTLIFEAVKNGNLKPYSNDSLAKQLTVEEFLANMQLPGDAPMDTLEAQSLYPDDWEKMMAQQNAPQYYFGKDLYQMEIREDVIFDKQKARMIYDIQAITIYVPADHPTNIKGIQMAVASFKYCDLINAFKDNPNAISFNPQNDAQHKSLADAFELRLFSSYIVKVSNPDDMFLTDIYRDQYTGLMASQWAAHEILEFEHNLWEF